jgi:glycosyltransferase involved in cell wall biosynthesis
VRVPSLAERHVPPADIIVATWWANAHDINGYGDSRGKKFYFIRHYETWGGPPDLVDKSYLLPLHRITSSTWLKELIETKFAVRVSGPFPNGIDSNVLYREREGYEAHTPRRIGMLFRRISWKGMTDGLTALAMVREAYPAVQLVLFGETPSRQAWSILGSGKGVEFHKLPYDDRLRHIYNSLDIFVFSSHEEGFGNPPLEAMACGAACVTTRVGAVPDYAIPGRTALVVEPRRPRELAQAVMDLLADENRRRGLARAGHDHVQQCTWENTVEELEKTFASVLEKERG